MYRATITDALVYLWRHKYGRLALLLVLIGAIGLILRYWTAVPLLLALPNRHEMEVH